ncbi:3-methyladenine DNA glycosylase AlkC [Chitinophaga sp. CF118]|uniref:DNA alkylation repair protein n=1 Tax=Chitinophaga sp. CF118 TaxID=1884367 RepID=UPI0008E1B4CC|nr:DNA alkylation repair protein [Chitinophaga sp. CF118]SFD47190.1 3-methyladenine DNA glycosylase AlkC [Chitinophaga sp. CF118]
MALLKDLYSLPFYNMFADSLVKTVPAFKKSAFIKKIFTEEFENMELKERMRHTARVLHTFMPESYPETVKLFTVIINGLRKDGFQNGRLEFMFFPDYIEVFGLEDYKNSVKAFEFITIFISCEFAVRPFILKYEKQMIEQMNAWSLHKNASVRRLASEGSRPRLPWAMALPALKKDPAPILPILDNLKQDPSESVRRSVANSLNDIAKDHPDIVIRIAGQWKGISKEVDAIIKHGSRTLLKQGHTEILKHYDLVGKHITLTSFKILTPKVKIGESLSFTFSFLNKHTKEQTVRLEYAVHYRRANGQLARKVFKISERIYQPGERAEVLRNQSFKLITTRAFYPGQQQLSVIINGEEKSIDNFILIG